MKMNYVRNGILGLGLEFGFILFFCKQANEVVKANNLSDTIIVLHGRVEVGLYDQAN